jgi:hypothetical protein
MDGMAASRHAEVALVDAPTGVTGFLLVVQMADSRSGNERHASGRWSVRVPVEDAAAIGTLLEKVQSWLRQERISETRVSVGGDLYRVRPGQAVLQERSEEGAGGR